VLYPFVMLTAVVVTGNHYILDGAGGVGAMALGVLLAWAVDRARGRRHGLRGADAEGGYRAARASAA